MDGFTRQARLSTGAAVAAPRFTQEWFPDEVRFEHAEMFPDLVRTLGAQGHSIVPPSPLPFQGDAHTIFVRGPNDYVSVADRRISGRTAGY